MSTKIVSIICLVLCAFTLAKAQDIQYKMVVAQDGSGDYTSIQDAIDATKAFPDKRISIYIKNGVYHEKVRVPSWNNLLSLIGEDVDKTIITYGDHFRQINRGRNSTFMTYTLLIEADDFYAENLTIINSAGKVGQAVALHVEGDRCAFNNCKLVGNQDTLYATGETSHQYFKNCSIEGTVDFIFGSATAVFDKCAIIGKANSYLTAASTTKEQPFGFVFFDCALYSTEEGSSVYLGRPWRIYAKTAFINCSMDKHIKPEGWHNWGKPEAETTTYYAEYKSTGDGANAKNRVAWSHKLSDEEAKSYTTENILGSWVLPYTK